MLIHSIIENSSVNGPGNRAVVWLQGCDLGCPGCWNQDTHSFHGKHTSGQQLASKLLSVESIEGITFSGGEPMQQLDDGLDLVIAWIKHVRPEFSIGMYTGYTERELETGEYRSMISLSASRRLAKYKKAGSWRWLKTYLDFAVMGRYNQQQRDFSRPMCSSRNQELVLFSDRYTLADFRPQEAEVIIGDEFVQVTGFPTGDLA